MTKTIPIAPVIKTLTVAAAQAHAFDVFTNGLDRWWPKGHGVGKTPVMRSIIEPRLGGRWLTQHEDGEEIAIGRITAWEPPFRLVFTWDINAQWKPDATVASQVEVTFTPQGPSATLVTLEHRNFEALGQEGGEKLRGDVNGGWPSLLDLFKAEAER